MQMIQIEQDSPELIAQVRRHIDEMVERTRILGRVVWETLHCEGEYRQNC